MLLHRERGLGCTLRLSMEIQPLGCCFDDCVLHLLLLVASVVGSLAGGRVGAFPDARSGVLGPSVDLQFTLLSGVWKTSQSFLVFRGYGSSFLPPTASRSFIGGTSAWSGPLLRVTDVSLAFGLATAVFRCGGGFTHGYGLSPVFLFLRLFGCGGRRHLSTLDVLCIDRKFFSVNPGLF